MQQMTPPQGRLFPDNPSQQSAPRFASNAPQGAQAYEPQLRMQQTGSVPVMTMPRYATGQLQALHGSQPVTQMPPMSSLPTVSVYQAMQAQPVNIPQTALEGTPIMVHTVQGAPVVVTKEEMERALASLEEATDGRKKSRRRKKDANHEGAKTVKVVSKFSVFWMIFGVIGIVSSAIWVWEWIQYLLVWLGQVTGGAA